MVAGCGSGTGVQTQMRSGDKDRSIAVDQSAELFRHALAPKEAMMPRSIFETTKQPFHRAAGFLVVLVITIETVSIGMTRRPSVRGAQVFNAALRAPFFAVGLIE